VYRLRGKEGSIAMAKKAKKKAAKKASTVKKAPAKKVAKPAKADAKAKAKPASVEVAAAAPAKVLKPLTLKQRLALIRIDPTTGRCPHNLAPETCAFCMSL
jgi:hypothetical protein